LKNANNPTGTNGSTEEEQKVPRSTKPAQESSKIYSSPYVKSVRHSIFLAIPTLFIFALILWPNEVKTRFWNVWDAILVSTASEEAAIGISVATPAVHTRERLLNDRFEQVAWLDRVIREIPPIQPQSLPSPSGSIPQTPSTNGSSRDLPPPPTTSVSGSGQPQSTGVTIEARTSSRSQYGFDDPIHNFNVQNGFRDVLRAERARAMLDDRHDMDGNTLYLLSFDSTVIPRPGIDGYAAVEVLLTQDLKDLPTGLDQRNAARLLRIREYQDLFDVYLDWLNRVRKLLMAGQFGMTNLLSSPIRSINPPPEFVEVEPLLRSIACGEVIRVFQLVGRGQWNSHARRSACEQVVYTGISPRDYRERPRRIADHSAARVALEWIESHLNEMDRRAGEEDENNFQQMLVTNLAAYVNAALRITGDTRFYYDPDITMDTWNRLVDIGNDPRLVTQPKANREQFYAMLKGLCTEESTRGGRPEGVRVTSVEVPSLAALLSRKLGRIVEPPRIDCPVLDGPHARLRNLARLIFRLNEEQNELNISRLSDDMPAAEDFGSYLRRAERSQDGRNSPSDPPPSSNLRPIATSCISALWAQEWFSRPSAISPRNQGAALDEFFDLRIDRDGDGECRVAVDPKFGSLRDNNRQASAITMIKPPTIVVDSRVNESDCLAISEFGSIELLHQATQKGDARSGDFIISINGAQYTVVRFERLSALMSGVGKICLNPKPSASDRMVGSVVDVGHNFDRTRGSVLRHSTRGNLRPQLDIWVADIEPFEGHQFRNGGTSTYVGVSEDHPVPVVLRQGATLLSGTIVKAEAQAKGVSRRVGPRPGRLTMLADGRLPHTTIRGNSEVEVVRDSGRALLIRLKILLEGPGYSGRGADPVTQAYSYGLTPRLRHHQVESLTRQDQINVSAQGVGAQLGRSDGRDIRDTDPEVIGFSRLNESVPNGRGLRGARFGWLVAPRPMSGDTRNALKTAQIQLGAVVAVPSWWRSAMIVICQRFVKTRNVADVMMSEFWGDPSRCRTEAIRLPGTSIDVSRQLGMDVVRYPYTRGWADQESSPESREDPIVYANDRSRPAQLLIRGGRLWRSTVVTLGGQKADSIEVLPDMDGVIATFKCVNVPLFGQQRPSPTLPSSRSELEYSNINMVRYKVPVVVWTSEGHTEEIFVQVILNQKSDPRLACQQQGNSQ